MLPKSEILVRVEICSDGFREFAFLIIALQSKPKILRTLNWR